MKNWKLPFSFNRQERSGLFFLCLCILLLQLGYYLSTLNLWTGSSPRFQVNTQWEEQLRTYANTQDTVRIYPFNPNYITDFKGYLLGLSASELDRLYRFRARGGYLSSPEDLKKVAGLSDSLLAALSPYLLFTPINTPKKQGSARWKPEKPGEYLAKGAVEPGDLNTATAADFRRISGIGPVLSERIVRFREALGGFLIEEQLADVYGLEAEVVARTLKQFRVFSKPEIRKVNINEASVEQLASLVYIPFPLAEAIVRRREESGAFRSLDEISHLEGFPSEKIDRIKLYLTL